MTSVLLSYARDDDEPFVRRLYEDLTERGFDVWFDREDMPGRGLTFLHEIREAINERDRLVLVVGPDAIESEYVEAEWRHALEMGKPVNPVLRLGDYPLLPDELKLLDTPDFRDDANYDARLETLVRQLSEPVPTMGKLVGVPSLPPHFLDRADRLRALKDAVMADLVRPQVVTGTQARTGVHGMGGIGKSVLVAALSRDTEVRRAFPDGVIWVEVGQEPKIVQLQREVAHALGDPGRFETQSEGMAKLAELLADRAVMLVLDDVWEPRHAEAFDALGPRCRMVMTTRDASLITALDGTEHQVHLLTEAESRHLMAEWAGQPEDGLPDEALEILAECDGLPLALVLCGALARDGDPWADLLEALQEADLEFLDHPHGSVLRTIKVSVDRLTEDEAARFAELRAFPGDETVPEDAVATLWTHTGAMQERYARRLLTTLANRALVQVDGVAPNRRVSLHDLVRDYTARIAPEEQALHTSVVEAYRAACEEGWASGPDDGYFFQHLARHLQTAGRIEELGELLTDYRFLDAKLRGASVQSLIEDYERAVGVEAGMDDEQAASLRLIGDALRLSAHVLAQDPDQLPTQVCGHTIGREPSGIQGLLRSIAAHRQSPWLRPVNTSLAQAGGPLLRTLTGHSDLVNAVAVTPDGRRVVSGAHDNTLKVWDLESGEELRAFAGHSDYVRAVAVTPDGRRALSAAGFAGRDELKMWDLDSGEELRTLEGHSDHVTAVAVTPDGRRAVSASWDRTLKVWDLDTGEELRTFAGHSDWVLAVAVTPDGRRVISGGGTWDSPGELKVWDLDSGEELRTLAGHSGEVLAVAVTPDGRWAVSGARYPDNALKVWDLDSGEELRTLAGHAHSVTAVAVTPDGRRAVSGSLDKTLGVWDLDSGERLRTLEGHRGNVNAVAGMPDGRRAVSGGGLPYQPGELRVWDMEGGGNQASSTGTAAGWPPWR